MQIPKLLRRCALTLAVCAAPMSAQEMSDMNPAGGYLMNLSSGTSQNPASWPMPMWMSQTGHWNLMFMGLAFLSDIQQSGPRGGDKLYSTNWFMAAAQHRAGPRGAFETVLMLSLEPATITNRRYPLLFQTGETAYGQPLVDAQHPHNFIMALGFHYAYQLGESTVLDAYIAPVGDPALGPVAFPHRASALDFPEAPISHHWQDSTHIADDVVTLGISHKKFKLESSGFHGAEPGENRWIIQAGPIDSWSARLWYFPAADWSMQVSTGRITHPEALEPGDQERTTASVHYTRPLPAGGWSTSLIWGRNHETAAGRNTNAYLAETLLPLTKRNYLSARFEFVDKDELFNPYIGTFPIRAYTLGFVRDIDIFRHIATGIGANFSAYTIPAAITPYYGAHPLGGNLFLRFAAK